MKKLLLLSLVLLVIPLGLSQISPGLVKIDYEPNQLVELPFIVSGSTGEIIELRIMEGPLYEYATIDKDRIVFSSSKSETVNLRLNIPSNLELYGVQSLRLEALRVPEEGGLLTITSGLRARIEVQFPYPDRYIELQGLNIVGNSIGQGQNAEAIWSVVNLGKEPVIYTTNLVLSYENGTIILDESFNSVTINAGQTIQSTETLKTETLRSGMYKLSKQLMFDEVLQTQRRDIRIGEKTVSVLAITESLKNDRINQFEVVVLNEWNEQMSNVRVELDIDGKLGRTDFANIGPYPSQERLLGFIDTTDLSLGEYDAKLTITFQDVQGQTITLEETKTITITDDAGETTSTNWVIISLSIVLVIFIILLLGLIYSMIRKNE